jgi:DNA polymerase-1
MRTPATGGGSGSRSTASSAPPRPPTSPVSASPRASRRSRPRRRARPAGLPQAGYVEVARLTPDDEAALGEWLADPAVRRPRTTRSRDARPPRPGLEPRRAHERHRARRLPHAPGQRSFDLADLTLRYLRRELRQGSEDEGGQLSLLGGEEEAEAERATAQMVAASAVAELADALDAELAEKAGSELLAELELPLEYVLADLETAGIAVDHDLLSSLEPSSRRR